MVFSPQLKFLPRISLFSSHRTSEPVCLIWRARAWPARDSNFWADVSNSAVGSRNCSQKRLDKLFQNDLIQVDEELGNFAAIFLA